MFERFTDHARQCVVLAQEEARELGHSYIGTEHLLLAAAREQNGLGGRVVRQAGATLDQLRADVRGIVGPGPIDRDALATLGIDLDEVRRRVEESFGAGALERGSRCGGQIPFTPRSKKALELAVRFAKHLGDDFIGTEHLLWALTRVEEGVAARILTERGITRESVESAIRRARQAA
jgi:ATP-dependent Clp protease ATP-binding subunit ClpA